jgi:hypothetical protein
MATKTDFTPEESTLLRAAPVLAGLRVAVADHGGNFDEVAAIAEAYGAAHERLWSTPPRGGVVDDGACGTVRCTRVVRPSTRRLKSSFASAARRR